MRRSEFIKAIGILGLGASMPFSIGANTKQSRGKVIVVGAGISGIGAARLLSQNNWEVQIVEARDRIGGRIWSDESLGKPVDMGASWIHEASGNPITKLTREFGIKTIETDWESLALYDYKGYKYSNNEVSQILDEGDWVLKKAVRLGNRQNSDRSVGWGIRRVLKEESYSPAELTQLNWRFVTQELDAGVEYEKLSSWGDDEDGFFGGDLIFPGGYAQVVRRLAEGLNIATNQPVKKIESNSKGVKIITENNTYAGDFAIVTLPLGTLKSGIVEFDPGLTPEKQQAISQLGMGNLNKVALKFPEIQWPTKPHFIGYISQTKGEFPVFVNWAHYVDQPYLLGTVGNAFARKLDELSDEQIKQKVEENLARAWKKEVNIDDIRYSGWAKDPYAGGSYSYLPVSVKGKLFDALAKPQGNIHFAGEATNRGMNATVHGAYLSGLREAELIIEK